MLFLLCLTTTGQNKQAEVAKIRKAYAMAKADAEKAQKGTDPLLGHMVMTNSHIEPGSGPQKEPLQYDYRRTEDQTTGISRSSSPVSTTLLRRTSTRSFCSSIPTRV